MMNDALLHCSLQLTRIARDIEFKVLRVFTKCRQVIDSNQDLDEFEEQITELLKSIKNSLEKEVPSLKGQERSEKCQYLRNRLNRAKQVHRAIVVELRGLTGADSSVWEGKAKDFEEQIARHLQDVEWAEANNTAAGGNAAAPKKKSKSNKDITSRTG